MTVWWLALTLISLAAVAAAFVWMTYRLSHIQQTIINMQTETYERIATQSAEQVFNEEFRQELRNRGRLHFEKIISENSMFLKQDLQLTTSQINEYMKKEVSRKLQEEFANYERSMHDAQAMAIDVIKKTITAVDKQRVELAQQLEVALEKQKHESIQAFEEHMTEVVTHYLAEAFGDGVALEDQMGYIMEQLEANKEAMKRDMYS